MIKTQKEYETRLMLTEEQYFFIVTYYMNIQPNKHFLQNTNHYFDTDDLYLRDHHMTLRVRTINDVKSELTLKIKGRNGDDEITDGLSPKEQELTDILMKSENGTEDIISTKSKIVKENDLDIDSMTVKQLIAFIKENPSVLKRPIIVDDHRIQVGYNPDEIRSFIPHARRLAEWACKNDNCPQYETCGHSDVKEA